MFGIDLHSFLTASSPDEGDVCRYSSRNPLPNKEDREAAASAFSLEDDTFAFCSDPEEQKSSKGDDFPPSLLLERAKEPSPSSDFLLAERQLSILLDKIKEKNISEMQAYVDALSDKESITLIQTTPKLREIYKLCIDALIEDEEDPIDLTPLLRTFAPLDKLLDLQFDPSSSTPVDPD